MTDSEILELREEYESFKLKIVQFAIYKSMDFEKVRYALRKALRLRREACVDITFTVINSEHNSVYKKADGAKCIIIKTTIGTTIQIPS